MSVASYRIKNKGATFAKLKFVLTSVRVSNSQFSFKIELLYCHKQLFKFHSVVAWNGWKDGGKDRTVYLTTNINIAVETFALIIIRWRFAMSRARAAFSFYVCANVLSHFEVTYDIPSSNFFVALLYRAGCVTNDVWEAPSAYRKMVDLIVTEVYLILYVLSLEDYLSIEVSQNNS